MKENAKCGKVTVWTHLEWEFAVEMQAGFDEKFPEPSAKPEAKVTVCLTVLFQLMIGFHIFAFCYERCGILGILEAFWPPFQRDGRTDGGHGGPAAPAPRAWISSRVRAAAPPLQ